MGRPRTARMDAIREHLQLDVEFEYLLLDPGNLWCVPQGKNKSKYRLYMRSEKQYLHRFIMNAEKGQEVDHVDGDPLNNKKENLRITNRAENSWNTCGHKDSKYSKYKGVSFWKQPNQTRAKPWVCQIMANGKKLKAYFSTEKEAASQYNIWAKQVHGPYAFTNIIEDENGI